MEFDTTRQTNLFLLILFSVLLIVAIGCGSSSSSSTVIGGGSSEPAVVSGKVLREAGSGSQRFAITGSATVDGDMRASSQFEPVAGAEVWIEILADNQEFHTETDASGTYVFKNVPQGIHRIVCKYTMPGGQTVMKNRSFEFTNQTSDTSCIVHDLILKEASNYVSGQLKDAEGNFLPIGTVCTLWGEPFKILAEGRFISPPLPDEVIEEQIVVTLPGGSSPAVFSAPFISNVVPAFLELTIGGQTASENAHPTVYLIARAGGQPVDKVMPGGQLTVKATADDADSADVEKLVPVWSKTKGSLVKASSDFEMIWTAPDFTGLATISVEISDPQGAKARAHLSVLVGIDQPGQADITAPTAVLSCDQTETADSDPFVVQIEFSETVTGFASSDIAVTNGSVVSFEVLINDKKFAATIKPSEAGNVIVSVPADVALDTSGNANSASQQLTVVNNVSVPKSTKAITAFSFADPAATGVVDEEAKTVAITVPFATDVTALVPTITHNGIGISPNSGVAQNFTNPVTYTVTAEDSTTQNYLVTVTVAASPARAITAFSFADPAATGIVDEEAKTVAITVPYGSDLTTLVPTITYTGASISPDSGVAQNFTDSVTYTVTAADSSTQNYVVTVSVAPSPMKSISAFSFSNPDASGVIDEVAKTISVTVPFASNVTALVPVIVHNGASVAPASGVAQNFLNPVNYTVTAADGSTQTYVVTVTVSSDSARSITAFNFASPVVTGVIDEGAKTVSLTVPYGTDVTALVPTISHTGSSISPKSGVTQDFTNPVTYTVTAADSSTQDYLVTVTVAASSDKSITAFRFVNPSVIGMIDEGAKTISVTVPYGTDITALIPEINHNGANISPNSGVAKNFTNPVTYTVAAADSSTEEYVVSVTVALNPAKAISAFSFSDPAATGVVDEEAKTVAITVPYGTNLTALTPSIIHSGASISPASGVAQNFTNPVTYTVTAADSSTEEYVVTVTVALNTAKAVTAFSFADPAASGVVDEETKTVAITVPYGTDVTALTPTITYTGASVSPDTGVAQDFTNPVTYTVTAADSSIEEYVVTVTVALNPAKAITAFSFAVPAATGVVDEDAKTVAITLPYGTDVTALTPSITHSGASISPASDVEQDFTTPVIYTVTAADSSTQEYEVTVTVAPDSARSITAFSFADPAASGVVDEEAKTVAITVPYGTDVTALVPTVTHTGTSISPDTGVAQNFTNPVAYTVTAADSSTEEYVVTVTVALNPAKAITAFSFADPATTGVVDEEAKTVAITVPYGTDVTALVPTITYTGASVSPDTGVAQNFTNPVTYTVTAADSSTEDYEVTVTVALNPAKAITAFSFADPATTGVVDEEAKTVAITVPYGTDVTALTPTITYTGASVSPDTGVAQNFTNPVTYTVTAADSSVEEYVVTVTVALNPAKAITAFSFAVPAATGVVNEEAKTVAITVPFGTDVTALVPTITHSGASISPDAGVAQNFTNPVNYTVTAADSTTVIYTVTVTQAPSTSKAITAFVFNALLPPVSGYINETDKTVTVKVPYGTSFTGLVPTITHTGASVSPNSGVAQNFTPGVAFTYTVTAADSSTQSYAVTVFQTAESVSPQSARLDILSKNIYGGSPSMEYSTDNGVTYTTFGANSVVNIPGLTVGNQVWVRMQGDDSSKSYLGEVKALSSRADLIATGTLYIGADSWNDRSYGAAGEARRIKYNFANIGDTSGGNVNHKIRFYISTDKKITADDVLLYEQTYDYSCGVGVVTGLTIDFTVPALTPGKYYIGAIFDATNVIAELNDDNNTTLPEYVAEFELTDGSVLPAGAFKFYNSWGVGFSGEKKADGWYWVTYQTMKKQEMMVSYYHNDFYQPYNPTVVAVFKITHPLRNEAKVIIGLGDPAAPYMSKELQNRFGSILLSGAVPFPDNNIVIDISEFAGAINDYDLFLRVENSGDSTGTIDNFSVEFYYDYNYASFKTIVGDTGSIPSTGNVNVIAATKNSLNLLELQQISSLPRAAEETSLTEEFPSGSELQSDMESHGVYVPGKNYNVIVDGRHGTGYQPPSIEQWQSMKKLRGVQSINLRGGQPTSVDHSKTPYFPPVGDQGAEGSCTAFSCAYYIHTYNEAREHNWNLTGTTWEYPDPTGLSSRGRPATNRDKIFSPDFVYHQINSGTNSGTSAQSACSLLVRLGGTTWSQMAYNTNDHSSWPSEAAWREACRYRGRELGNRYWEYHPVGYLMVKTDADIDLLKTLISSGYCVSTSVRATNPGLYQLLDANDVVDDAVTAKMETDHAQTIVGYKEGADWNPANPDL